MAMCGCPDCTGVDVLAEVDSPELPIKAWYEEVGDLSTVRNRSVGFNRREGDVALVLESDALTGFSVRDTRIGELVEVLRKIMEAHRFNVSGMTVTEVHSICFDVIAAQRAQQVG